MLQNAILLLVVFQIKHFVADYPCQTSYMMGKFKAQGWVLPLLAHAGVHGGLTFLIALAWSGSPLPAFGLSLLDLCVHFGVDRVKASPRLLGRFKPLFGEEFKAVQALAANHRETVAGYYAAKRLQQNTFFWWSLGLDQALHHLTHYAIIWFLLSR